MAMGDALNKEHNGQDQTVHGRVTAQDWYLVGVVALGKTA